MNLSIRSYPALRPAVRYLSLLGAFNLVWEFAQMPLYTLGTDGRASEILFAGLHCTVGDVMIGASALLGGVVLTGARGWPHRRHWPVLTVAMAIGLGYTLFSEWYNVEVRGAWAYSRAMPILPVVGAGLAPVLQWLLLPPLAYHLALRPARCASDGGAGTGAAPAVVCTARLH